MNLRAVLLVLALMVSGQAFSQSEAMKALKAEMASISNSPYMKPARWSFVVLERESGKAVIERNADETMLPASTMKTVTSAAAFALLGENFRFETHLEIDGVVEEGALKGNLYLRGGGDPTLGSDRFKNATSTAFLLDQTVLALKAAGIKEIDGQVIGDASIFDSAILPNTWVWSDVGNYYGAGACGLSFEENLYHLYFEPNAVVGKEAKILRTEPDLPGVTFVNEMKTGKKGSGDQGYIYGSPYSEIRYLRGSIPQGKSEFSIKGSLPDPPYTAAYFLHNAIQEGGIPISGTATSMRRLGMEDASPEGERKLLFTHKSPPLKDIIYWLNKKSVNLFAEHLVKVIGFKVKGEGTTEAGTAAIAAYWRKRGINVDGMHMKDGSGLSRYNGITARQLAGMLRDNAQQTWFESFYNSLPIAGNASDPGTLRRMCTGTAAANNVRAKSGFISRVRAYAGYVSTKSGKELTFAMLSNNYTCKASQMRNMFADLMVKLAELD